MDQDGINDQNDGVIFWDLDHFGCHFRVICVNWVIFENTNLTSVCKDTFSDIDILQNFRPKGIIPTTHNKSIQLL